MLTRNVDERKFTKPPAGRPPRRRPARERINLWGLVGGSAGVVRGYACRTIAPEVRKFGCQRKRPGLPGAQAPRRFCIIRCPAHAAITPRSRHHHGRAGCPPAAALRARPLVPASCLHAPAAPPPRPWLELFSPPSIRLVSFAFADLFRPSPFLLPGASPCVPRPFSTTPSRPCSFYDYFFTFFLTTFHFFVHGMRCCLCLAAPFLARVPSHERLPASLTNASLKP